MRAPTLEPAVQRASRRLDDLAHAHPELLGPSGENNAAAWLENLQHDTKGNPMAPKSTEPGEQLAFRFPKSLVERIDRHAERLAKQNPGLEFSRSDVVRTLLTRALDEIEAGDKRRKG